jgi:hypothetical protein
MTGRGARRQVHCLAGGQCTRAGHHGHPPAGGLDQLGELLALGLCQGGELPRAPSGD